MDKYRRMTDTQRGFGLRAGLRAGLDCSTVDNRRYITYTCGNTKCNMYKPGALEMYPEGGLYSCTTSRHNALISGIGMDQMKQEMAGLNNVQVSDLNI